MNDDDGRNSIALIVFSGDMDKIFAALTIATGAAASGMKVSMFFTFWGLKLLQEKGSKRGKNDFLRRLFNVMVKPGPDKRPISRMNMGGAGAAMMKKIMKKSKLPSLAEMLTTAKSLDVKFTACSTSMNVMGIPKESLIPEVDSVAGVASFLAVAQESGTTLFI